MIPFNINDYVKVKLTQHGRDLHRKRHESFGEGYAASFPYVPVKEDSEGWSEWQLWQLMSVFGKHCYNGCELPFETDIKIIHSTLETERRELVAVINNLLGHMDQLAMPDESADQHEQEARALLAKYEHS